MGGQDCPFSQWPGTSDELWVLCHTLSLTTGKQILTLTNETHSSCTSFCWLHLEEGWWWGQLCTEKLPHPLYFMLHQYITQSFKFDENGYGEAYHDDQLNSYPLGDISETALFTNNPTYIHKDQERFAVAAALACTKSHARYSSWVPLGSGNVSNTAQCGQANQNSTVNTDHRSTPHSRERHTSCFNLNDFVTTRRMLRAKPNAWFTVKQGNAHLEILSNFSLILLYSAAPPPELPAVASLTQPQQWVEVVKSFHKIKTPLKSWHLAVIQAFKYFESSASICRWYTYRGRTVVWL